MMRGSVARRVHLEAALLVTTGCVSMPLWCGHPPADGLSSATTSGSLRGRARNEGLRHATISEMTAETRSPGPGRPRYGWAVIGSAACACAFGGFLGALRALSYSPPAWGYVAICGLAIAAAVALGFMALRRYGSPQR